MCGILGAVLKTRGGFCKRTEDAFFEMLYAGALRGFDSTGIIGAQKDGSFGIAKEANEAAWVVPQLKGAAISKDMWQSGVAYIGHNRKKTVGKIEDETAHPFVIDNTFAMVHNGTLYNHQQLAKTDVDSEALAIVLKPCFEQADYIPALEEQLGKVCGAYAIAAYEQKSHRVFLLRNKERPLSVIETDDAWFFASEAPMAAWILARNGYDYSKLKFTHIPEHVLFTFDLDKNTLKQEVLTPKKATPPIQNVTTKNGGYTFPKEASTGDKMTSKELHKFKKAWLGKRVSFWVDEFLENDFPLTLEVDGVTKVELYGRHDEIKYSHSIAAEVDLALFDIKQKVDVTDRKWIGTFEDVEMSSTGTLNIKFIDAKPVQPSLTTLDLTARKTFRESLTKIPTEELEELYETNRFGIWAAWQIAACNAEMNARNKIMKEQNKVFKNIQEAIDFYRNLGQTLEATVLAGVSVLRDKQGKIVYETPTTIH